MCKEELKVAHTGLNDVSSPSNAVLSFAVSNGSSKGKFNLVDLAGPFMIYFVIIFRIITLITNHIAHSRFQLIIYLYILLSWIENIFAIMHKFMVIVYFTKLYVVSKILYIYLSKKFKLRISLNAITNIIFIHRKYKNSHIYPSKTSKIYIFHSKIVDIPILLKHKDFYFLPYKISNLHISLRNYKYNINTCKT